MKIVCICNGGNNRSVALAWAFKYHNDRFKDRLPYEADKQHEVITVGAYYTKPSTLRMLAEWCDVAVHCCTQEKIVNHLITIFKWKLNTWDVGEDSFGTPWHPLLLEKAMDKAKSVLEGRAEGWR